MLVSVALYVMAVGLLVPWLGNHGLWLALMVFMTARGITLAVALPALDRTLR
jgi:MATE family multidrug resistance protein